MTGTPSFPFSAIVDQSDLKEALMCNVVNPEIGGVLISGTRGTAKSTAARSLAQLLPHIKASAACPYNCPPDDPHAQCDQCAELDFDARPELVEEIQTPFVNLPIGATEDRVVGSIDLETAIQEGERSFEPGLLAQANRGILYVDEVNLLDDHLVDILLDAVATGTNRVEREGISFEHPADVLLVGTMNPEEGELRPQLLDRFGLYVEIERDMTPEDRKSVVRRRTKYDADPDGMMDEWRDKESSLQARIEEAQALFPETNVSDVLLDKIVDLCAEQNVDGLRADIVIHRTARALAALDGTRAVEETHVNRAAELALGHRARTDSTPDRPGSPPPDGNETDQDQPGSQPQKPDPEELPVHDKSTSDSQGFNSSDDPGDQSETDPEGQLNGLSGESSVFPITDGVDPPEIDPGHPTVYSSIGEPGGRMQAITDTPRGAYVRARRPKGRVTDIALDATIRAAAPHQATRKASTASGPALTLRPSDLREKERRSRSRNLVVFVVDSSGSMGIYERMSTVKGAILSLLKNAYQHRDYVSLVGFRGSQATTLLPPTSSHHQAVRELTVMPTGGRTPLAAGLDRGISIVEDARKHTTKVLPLIVLVSDGRTNYSETGESPVKNALHQATRIRQSAIPAICYDTETGPVRMGIVRRLAERMDAEYYRIGDLQAGGLPSDVRDVLTDQAFTRRRG